METLSTSSSDPLKDHWWVLVLAACFVIGWLALATPPETGSESVQVASAPESDDALKSLDAAENPVGAPGSALGIPESAGGSYGRASDGAGASSSLYTAPGGAAGAPIADAAAPAAKPAAENGDTLVQAMRKVASSTPAPAHGSWGDKSARTGLAKPKASFDQVGSSRGGQGTSTSASFQVVNKAFGLGGDPGNPSLGGALSDGSKLARAGGPENRSLSGLGEANKVALSSLKGPDESMAGGGRQTFDQSAAQQGAMSQLSAAGGVGVRDDSGVPMNLKDNDPKKLDQKEFEVPAVKDTAAVTSGTSMEEKLMMMAASAIVGGLAGPMAGGMVMMMLQQESANKK
ncbi:MAG: hypothetical protein A2X36_14045 [Elusimicrobia bacterium GWA2_69_24]|nr:MAG: hypothetical protein A2X36_14045 [Elusimicrobia bacterium GWA2_69_24]HBL17289.1 hypothetical protein [Elusimicrobiota bacterium]